MPWRRRKRSSGAEVPDSLMLLLPSWNPKWRSGTAQGATALSQGPEGLLAGRRLQELVVVPRAAGLPRGLDFEEIGRVQLSPVGADGAGAEGVVLGRHGLHAAHRLSARSLGGGAHVLDRLEVVERRCVAARMHHRRGLDAETALEPV